MMHLERRQVIERIRVIIERIGVIIERVGVITNNPHALYNPFCAPLNLQ